MAKIDNIERVLMGVLWYGCLGVAGILGLGVVLFIAAGIFLPSSKDSQSLSAKPSVTVNEATAANSIASNVVAQQAPAPSPTPAVNQPVINFTEYFAPRKAGENGVLASLSSNPSKRPITKWVYHYQWKDKSNLRITAKFFEIPSHPIAMTFISDYNYMSDGSSIVKTGYYTSAVKKPDLNEFITLNSIDVGYEFDSIGDTDFRGFKVASIDEHIKLPIGKVGPCVKIENILRQGTSDIRYYCKGYGLSKHVFTNDGKTVTVELREFQRLS